MSNHALEVAGGQRFEFGKNWRRFLKSLSTEQIAAAESSLKRMLHVADLEGTSFLDIGSGSGLLSLAARRLGARVHSFDYDPRSVGCAEALRERFFPGDPDWTIEAGSVLDLAYLQSLGKFELVYSWGVLHHTGAMWQALENATWPVMPGGRLFIAIYNHQVHWTRVHSWLKRAYVASPRPVRWLMAGVTMGAQVTKGLVKDLALLRNPRARYRDYHRSRGMSWWHDTIDWLGGYPFETAPPEAIFEFFQGRGFVLERLLTCGGGHGCNQFVFRKALDRWTWSKHPYVFSVAPPPHSASGDA